MKTVTVYQYPPDSIPHVFNGVETYDYDYKGDHLYFIVRGKLTEDNIPYEVLLPLHNIILIRAEG
ncbi:hypothetical protein [Pseudomonas phage GP100]|nr:hypothetical protein [Pseudomonas phage GP100]